MAEIVKRLGLMARIMRRLRSNPVVLLLGPRQCGKTTLAREFAAGRKAEYFDLVVGLEFSLQAALTLSRLKPELHAALWCISR